MASTSTTSTGAYGSFIFTCLELTIDTKTGIRYHRIMINSFGDTRTEKFYRTKEHKTLKKLGLINRSIVMLDVMDSVDNLVDLKSGCFPPDVRIHKLKGEHNGFWAIDIHKVLGMRIIFKFEDNLFEYVSILDYHKG